MENLFLNRTNETPLVNFDLEKQFFLLEGISMPEDPFPFFNEIYVWLSEYSKIPVDGAKFTFNLEYFNSLSAKSLLEIMKQIKAIGYNNSIEWICRDDDEEMIENLSIFRQLLGNCMSIKILS